MDLLGVTAAVHDLKGTVYSKSAKINELEDKITKFMVENHKLSEQLSDNLQTKFSIDSIVKRESKIKGLFKYYTAITHERFKALLFSYIQKPHLKKMREISLLTLSTKTF
jgi:hypothetical protein